MPGDPNWSNVGLLCHFDGTNGATTYTDSSASAHNISSVSSGSSLTTSNFKFGTASLTIGSSSQYARVTSGVAQDFQFGSGQFTVECWAYKVSGSYANPGVLLAFDLTSARSWLLYVDTSTLAVTFQYSTNGSSTSNVASGSSAYPGINQWVHMAADRDASNVLRVYVNGAVVASATVSASFFAGSSANNMCVGNTQLNTSQGWTGQIDDARITKGVARYAGAFTPPTAAFPDGPYVASTGPFVSLIQ